MTAVLAFMLGVAATLWAVGDDWQDTQVTPPLGVESGADAPAALSATATDDEDPATTDTTTADASGDSDSEDASQASSPGSDATGNAQPGADGPAAATPQAVSGAARAGAGRRSYQVRVGAFLDADNAAQVGEAVRASGLPVQIQPQPDPEGRDWYIVQVGPYRDRSEATDVAGRLRRSQGYDALVISVDGSSEAGS